MKWVKFYLQFITDDIQFLHCMKSVQIRMFFWSVFSLIWIECGTIFRKNTEKIRNRKKLRIWTLLRQFEIKAHSFLNYLNKKHVSTTLNI